jgi:hypothetical protein
LQTPHFDEYEVTPGVALTARYQTNIWLFKMAALLSRAGAIGRWRGVAPLEAESDAVSCIPAGSGENPVC